MPAFSPFSCVRDSGRNIPEMRPHRLRKHANTAATRQDDKEEQIERVDESGCSPAAPEVFLTLSYYLLSLVLSVTSCPWALMDDSEQLRVLGSRGDRCPLVGPTRTNIAKD